MDPNDPPSDEQYQAMLDRTEQLAAEFTESRQFEALTSHQQQETKFAIENAGEFLAAYEGVPINDPDSQSLDFVCTRLYPAKSVPNLPTSAQSRRYLQRPSVFWMIAVTLMTGRRWPPTSRRSKTNSSRGQRIQPTGAWPSRWR